MPSYVEMKRRRAKQRERRKRLAGIDERKRQEYRSKQASKRAKPVPQFIIDEARAYTGTPVGRAVFSRPISGSAEGFRRDVAKAFGARKGGKTVQEVKQSKRASRAAGVTGKKPTARPPKVSVSKPPAVAKSKSKSQAPAFTPKTYTPPRSAGAETNVTAGDRIKWGLGAAGAAAGVAASVAASRALLRSRAKPSKPKLIGGGRIAAGPLKPIRPQGSGPVIVPPQRAESTKEGAAKKARSKARARAAAGKPAETKKKAAPRRKKTATARRRATAAESAVIAQEARQEARERAAKTPVKKKANRAPTPPVMKPTEGTIESPPKPQKEVRRLGARKTPEQQAAADKGKAAREASRKRAAKQARELIAKRRAEKAGGSNQGASPEASSKSAAPRASKSTGQSAAESRSTGRVGAVHTRRMAKEAKAARSRKLTDPETEADVRRRIAGQPVDPPKPRGRESRTGDVIRRTGTARRRISGPTGVPRDQVGQAVATEQRRRQRARAGSEAQKEAQAAQEASARRKAYREQLAKEAKGTKPQKTAQVKAQEAASKSGVMSGSDKARQRTAKATGSRRYTDPGPGKDYVKIQGERTETGKQKVTSRKIAEVHETAKEVRKASKARRAARAAGKATPVLAGIAALGAAGEAKAQGASVVEAAKAGGKELGTFTAAMASLAAASRAGAAGRTVGNFIGRASAPVAAAATGYTVGEAISAGIGALSSARTASRAKQAMQRKYGTKAAATATRRRRARMSPAAKKAEQAQRKSQEKKYRNRFFQFS